MYRVQTSVRCVADQNVGLYFSNFILREYLSRDILADRFTDEDVVPGRGKLQEVGGVGPHPLYIIV